MSRGGRGLTLNRRRPGGAIQTPTSPPTTSTMMLDDSSDNPPSHPVSISWPVSITINSEVAAGTSSHDAPGKRHRDRQSSWCSTAGASEPIDIPHSPRDESVLGESEQQGLDSAASGGGDAQGGNCWSAAWYQQIEDCTTEPWMRRSEESPNRPRAKSGAPFHIQIWDERSARQMAGGVLVEQNHHARESTDDDLPSRGDISSEDNSIFEMDM